MIHTQTTKDKISKACIGRFLGKTHPNWKGGRVKDKSGYILIKMRNHPDSNPIGYIREHRLVAEKIIGRRLKKTEIIHHINGKKDDNRRSNLFITTKRKHDKISSDSRKRNNKGQFI